MQIKRAARIGSRRDGPARLTLRRIIINLLLLLYPVSPIASPTTRSSQELYKTERDVSRGYQGLQGPFLI